MARNQRGQRQGAQQGSRAKGAGKGGDPKPGKPSRYSGTARVRGAEWGPCPARGKHDRDCICGGTGRVQVSK
jgi:hypothetical protein